MTQRGTKTNGRRINIPKVEEFSENYRNFAGFNNLGLRGRPSRVMQKLLLFGIRRGWFDVEKVYKELFLLGMDKGWYNDVQFMYKTLRWSTEWLARDMNWTSSKRIKELEGGLDGDGILSKTRRG